MSSTSSLLGPFTTVPPSPPPTPAPRPTTTTDYHLFPESLLEFSVLLQKYLPPSLAAAWDPNLPLGINISSLLGKDKQTQLGVQGLCVCGCVCRREGVSKEGKIKEEEIRRVVVEKFSRLLAAKQARMPGYGNGYEEQEKDTVDGRDGLEKSRTCWYWATAGQRCSFTATGCRDLHAFIPVNAQEKGWEEGEAEDLARLLGLMAAKTDYVDMEVDENDRMGSEVDGWEVVMPE